MQIDSETIYNYGREQFMRGCFGRDLETLEQWQMRMARQAISAVADKPTLLVWWLNPADCEWIDSVSNMPVVTQMPAYIYTQYRSRYGRPGRGRLWRSPELGSEPIVIEWPATALARRLAEDYGGIVIRERDLPALKGLPGIVTDMSLDQITRTA